MRIISFGDIHMAISQIERLAGELEKADLTLVSGDLTNFGAERDTLKVLEAIRARCPQVLAVPGNLDQAEAITWLEAEGISLHGKGQQRDGVALFGCGGSNITPFHTPIELEDQEIERLLERAYQEVGNKRPLLMVSHTPPYNTTIDRLRDGRHVGSAAVRAVVERYQPNVCVSGHVHEARGTDQLGATTLVNAGPLREGGYIVIDVPVRGELSVELSSL